MKDVLKLDAAIIGFVGFIMVLSIEVRVFYARQSVAIDNVVFRASQTYTDGWREI